MELPASADVVLIGGGAIGASTAFHLTNLGLTNVVLLERDVLAAGSTSKSAGGIRLQFADELNVRIMLRSLPAFEEFEQRFGVDIGLRQPGYLFLIGAQDEEQFVRAVGVQHSLGVPTQWLSLEQVSQRVPQIDPSGLTAAVYNARDGYATPEAVVHGYVSVAAQRGVSIHQGCAVTDIDVVRGRIAAVRTTKGTIRTDTVVCAAGADSANIGQFVGVDIPVRAEPHWLHYSHADCGLPVDLPLTIDFASGLYLHREGSGLVIGGRERRIDDLATTATTRIPSLVELQIQSSWWGNYEMSRDHNAIIGCAAEPEGFYYATGFSGHGFQQCPAVGEHLAERITGRRPTLDLTPLSLDRFTSGTLREEAFVV